MKDIARIAEALLFSSNHPLSTQEMARAASVEEEELEAALERLKDELKRSGSAVELRQIAHGWELATQADFAPWIASLGKVRPPARLSRAALEALVIVAYRQPVTRAEVEAVRGVECGGVIRTLLERRMVAIGERKETPGRPYTYITTPEFLAHFGLHSIADLPRLEEVEQLLGNNEGLFADRED